MPQITENGNTYWLPEVFPEPTKEYQAAQEKKRYLTPDGVERMHPGWTYAENVAYVDDEYLFENEGWKLIIGEAPVEPIPFFKNHYIKNAIEEWTEIDERTVEATYTLSGWVPEVFPEATSEYQATQFQKRYLTPNGKVKLHPGWIYTATDAPVDDEYLFQNEGWKLVTNITEPPPSVELKKTLQDDVENWEELSGGKTVKITYRFVDFTEEEVSEYIVKKWETLRSKRNSILDQTDWLVVKSKESGTNLSTNFKEWRENVRNFPTTITNILEFDLEDDTLWPTPPTGISYGTSY